MNALALFPIMVILLCGICIYIAFKVLTSEVNDGQSNPNKAASGILSDGKK